MKEGTRARWIGFGVAAALVAVVALAGWGLLLAATQGGEIEKFLAYTARLHAERRLEAIAEGIARRETELLDALTAAAASAPSTAEGLASALDSVASEHDDLERPFLLAGDFTLLYPPLETDAGTETSPLLRDEPAPEDFRTAMRLLSSGAAPAEARRALEAVHGAPEIAAPWRLRAGAALAAMRLRAGDACDAATMYETLVREFREELEKPTTRPSRSQLALARAEALTACDRRVEAATLLAATVERFLGARLSATRLDEERFFTSRVAAWRTSGKTSGATAVPELDRLDGLLRDWREREQLFRLNQSLRDWETIPARIRVEAASGAEAEGPRHFLERGSGRQYLVVWRLAGAQPSRHGELAAIGFHLHTQALRQSIRRMLETDDSRSGGFELALFEEDEATAGMPAVPLPGELAFLKVGVEERSWQRRLREARRPYRLAAALIPALGLVMVLALVTFWLAFQRERFLSKMKTDFVANVSHELKTPLALIRLFGETLSLERVDDPAKKKEYYDIIVRESDRLTHLINNVLDFASIEADRKSYDLFPADLGAIVSDTLRTYRFHLEEKGFALSTDIAEDLPPCLADHDGIAQAVINLLNNAVKYSTDRKEISVRVWRDAGAVKVAIADRGVGIPAEDLRRIFEGFYRSKSIRNLGRRGSGLGLALVQHIVTSHRGRIDVQSREGEGSTFTIAIPICDSDAEANVPSRRSADAE